MADDKQTTGGDAGAGDTGAAEARFTQDDLNRLLAKERRKYEPLEKQAAELQAKLQEQEQAKKTEFEKAIEAAAVKARKDAESEWSAKLTAAQIDSELRGRLRDKGYHADLAHIVKAKTTLTSVDDIDSAIETALGEEWKPAAAADPVKPRQFGVPTPPAKASKWNAARLAEINAKNMAHTLTHEDWSEIRRLTASGEWQ